MPTFNFTGPIPDWVDPEREGWTFLAAVTIFGQEGLSAEIEAATRAENIHLQREGWGPEFQTSHVIPNRPFMMPDVQEVWWEDNASPYRSRATPYFIQSLLNGTARAFGDPGRAGAAPEWIAPRVWWGLKPSVSNRYLFEGGGCIYWNVRVVDRVAFLSQAEVETDSKQEASQPLQDMPEPRSVSKGGQPPSPSLYAFAREMIRTADLDGLPDVEKPTSKHMRDWCDRQFPNGAPAESTIRAWLLKLDYRKPEHSQEASS